MICPVPSGMGDCLIISTSACPNASCCSSDCFIMATLISFITARLRLPVAKEAREDSMDTELIITMLSVTSYQT